jgi:hypothetical protein
LIYQRAKNADCICHGIYTKDFREGTESTIGTWAKIEEQAAMKNGKAPKYEVKRTHAKEKLCLNTEDTDGTFTLAISSRILLASGFDKNVTFFNKAITPCMTSPEFTTTICANYSHGETKDFAGMLNKPGTEIDGWVFGTTEKAPSIGGLGFNYGKEAGEATDGWYFIETKVHLKASTDRKEESAD